MSIMHKLNSAKNYLMLFGAFSIIGLSSCTDDEPTTSGGGVTIGGAFPTTAGSYWVYQNQATDSLGNLIPEVIGLDSTVAGTSYSLDGKTAVDFTTYPGSVDGVYDVSDTAKSVVTYAKENNTIYISTANLVGGLGSEGGLPIDITDLGNIDKWLIGMQDKNTWDMLTFPVELPSFDLGEELPMSLAMSGAAKITGTKEKTETVTIGGKTYNTIKFAMTVDFTADIKLSEQFLLFPAGTKVATISNPGTTYMWIAEGVGVVKTESSPSTTKFTIAPAFESIAGAAGFGSSETKNGGSVSTILRYNVKK